MTIRVPPVLRRVGLAALLALTLVAAGAPPGPRAQPALTGACYCRAASEVRWCETGMTEGACRERCASELCDDWFWLEQRPCWNWGYGG
jgi:hypothetical protein